VERALPEAGRSLSDVKRLTAQRFPDYYGALAPVFRLTEAHDHVRLAHVMTASRIVIAAFVGLSTFAAFGQVQPPATGSQDTTTPPVAPAAGPVNGPRDSGQTNGNRNNQTTDANAQNGEKPLPPGPDIIDDPSYTPEQKASAEYSGPAVLSRGISASQPLNPKNIRFTPNVGVEYVYSSGLTGTAVQSNGSVTDASSSGVQLSYGIVGEKVLKKDTISLGFSGNLYHYVQASSLDGSDNQLSFTWSHHLSRHFSFGIRESLQEYDRNTALVSGSTVINSGLGTTFVTASPATEAFDGRVFTALNEGNITWQVNSRFSINLTGGGFFTSRASSALYGDTGYQAGADVAYRLTRHVTFGAYYSYTHFDFSGIYGGTDVNTAGLTYSIAFNPSTELITRVGGSRLETTGIQNVTLDPLIGAIFGVSGTAEAVYLKNFSPDINLQVRRKVPNADLSIAYARGVTPGNGLILTSVRQTISLGANYRAIRRWTIANSAGYDTLSSFGVSSQRYASVFVGASVYRKVHKNLDWHARLDFHHYTFDNTGFLRNSIILSTGFVWTPGDILERLW
jgi:hypothetical protein